MSLLLNPFLFAAIDTPPSLPVTSNLLSWHAGDYSPSVVESGGRVSQWSDISGNENHLVQPTGSLQPEITTLNGINALSMGSREYNMYYSTAITFNAYTTFIVFRIDEAANSSSTANNIFYPNSVGTLGNGGLRIGGNFSAAWSNEVTTWWHFSNGPNYINGVANTSTYTSGSTYILSTKWDNSSTREIRRNNSVLSLANATSTGGYTGGSFTSTASPKNIKHLCGTDVSTPSFNGVVAETIVYNTALSSTDIDSVYSYLSGRWT